jgi:hypothetical protein
MHLSLPGRQFNPARLFSPYRREEIEQPLSEPPSGASYSMPKAIASFGRCASLARSGAFALFSA